MSGRQPKLLIATAAKGGGKSRTTSHSIDKYIRDNPSTGKPARKFLIYDVNGEYTSQKLRGEYGVNFDAPILALKDLPEFTQQRRVEVRRILPLDSNNCIVDDIDVMIGILNTILTTYRGGGLLLEDINAYMIGTSTKQVISSITRNRHKDLDLYIHLQGLRAMSPRLWANVNIIRLHRQNDNIQAYADRIPNPELFYIGQSLVKLKTVIDPYFYCYIDVEEERITGLFSKREYWIACYTYLLETPSALKFAKHRFGNSEQGRKYALQYVINDLMKYYGN